MRNFSELAEGKHLFITEKGRLGLPDAIQNGDVIAILSGSCPLESRE